MTGAPLARRQLDEPSLGHSHVLGGASCVRLELAGSNETALVVISDYVHRRSLKTHPFVCFKLIYAKPRQANDQMTDIDKWPSRQRKQTVKAEMGGFYQVLLRKQETILQRLVDASLGGHV